MAKKDIKTTKNVVPMIYAYTTPEIARHDGWTKIGYTENDVDKRLNEQTHTADVKYKEEWRGKAEFDDGSGETFTDHDFHRHLTSKNIERLEGTEFFKISPDDSKNEFYSFRLEVKISMLEGVSVVHPCSSAGSNLSPIMLRPIPRLKKIVNNNTENKQIIRRYKINFINC